MAEPTLQTVPAPEVVLALDTATAVAVGLARGDEVLARVTLDDPRAHVEQLTPLVRRCLAEAGLAASALDRLVCGLGPGPFTGLRVGVASAQVLALALGLPLRGVCSLDVLARQQLAEPGTATGEFVVATDARRREVYWARYAADGSRLEGPSVSAPADVPRLPTVGPGADLYPDALSSVPGPRALDPGLLAVHGWRLPDAGREPLYLRRPDAVVPTRRKSVLLPRDPAEPRR